MQHRGLGDTIKMITGFTGVDKLVEKAVEKGIIKDCGCNQRQENLNEKFPYKKRKK